MARKLSPEEAEVFNGAMDASQIPTEAEAFLRNLLDQPDESLEIAPSPALWLSHPDHKPFES